MKFITTEGVFVSSLVSLVSVIVFSFVLAFHIDECALVIHSEKPVAPIFQIQTKASYYGEEYKGKTMANGNPFDPAALTCASWHYPFGTVLDVRRVGVDGNPVGPVVSVTVTDRGPSRHLADKGRGLDLSQAAFEQLAPLSVGVIQVSFHPRYQP